MIDSRREVVIGAEISTDEMLPGREWFSDDSRFELGLALRLDRLAVEAGMELASETLDEMALTAARCLCLWCWLASLDVIIASSAVKAIPIYFILANLMDYGTLEDWSMCTVQWDTYVIISFSYIRLGPQEHINMITSHIMGLSSVYTGILSHPKLFRVPLETFTYHYVDLSLLEHTNFYQLQVTGYYSYFSYFTIWRRMQKTSYSDL